MTHSIPSSLSGDLVATSDPYVFTRIKAYPLVNRFMSCPAAAKLLGSGRFINPIIIDTRIISGARTATAFDSNYTPLSATIFIAEEALDKTEGLQLLAFEFFNAQRTSNFYDLFREASLGNIGMDSFARKREEYESADTKEHYDLIKQCGNHWTMSSEELEAYTKNENDPLEVELFIQESGCHTDFYRQAWVKNFQQLYCEKHPADSRSCEIKTTDLCNMDMVRSMSESERKEFRRERACEQFPQAHLSVKNDPQIRKAMQEKCPEVLEKSSPQPVQEEL